MKTNFVEELRKKLVKKTNCATQYTGWPCNTCFHAMRIKTKEDIHEYWEAVLKVRGDYNDYDFTKDGGKEPNLNLLIELNKVLGK